MRWLIILSLELGGMMILSAIAHKLFGPNSKLMAYIFLVLWVLIIWSDLVLWYVTRS